MAKINDTVEKTVNKPDFNSILSRLEKVEEENRKLKESKETSFQKAKKIVDGPREFSYKLWGGVPVCEYKTIKKDPTKDLHYKNTHGEYVSNHFLEILLSNNKYLEVEVNEFNNSHTRSEKINAYDENGKIIELKDKPMSYTFKDTEHGTFTVLPNMIN